MSEQHETIRYLAALKAQCEARPDLHPHQLAAYESMLESARGAASAADLTARLGDYFVASKAMVLDRYENAARIARALGDDRKVRAAVVVLEAAYAARDHQELNAAIETAGHAAAPLTHAAQVSCGQVRSLFTALLDWGVAASPSARAGHHAMLMHAWEQIRQVDPDCSWQKLCQYPPYRTRIPFTSDQLAELEAWFSEAVN